MATFNQLIFNTDFNTTFEDGFSYSFANSDSIANDGTDDYLTIGAPYKYSGSVQNTGKVYNYQRIAGTWVLQQSILPPINNLGGYFGIINSLYYKNSNLSAANFFQIITEPISQNVSTPSKYGYVHLLSANSFNSFSYYKSIASPRVASTHGFFGHSFSLTALPLSTFALITERSTPTAPGSAYIFTVDSDNKTFELRKPIRCQSSTQGKFGYAGVFADDLLVITDDERDYLTNTTAGTAFYYSWDPNDLTTGLNSPKALNRSYISPQQKFGASIAYNSGILAVGAPGERDTFQGKVYIYKKNSAVFTEIDWIEVPSPWIATQADLYGASVSLVRMVPGGDNLNLLVGCPYFNNGIPTRGAVFCYNYSLSADTISYNNTAVLSYEESPSVPGNSFGVVSYSSPNYTLIGAGNSTGALLPTSAASIAYVYNGSDIFNTSSVMLFSSATFVTQPYAFTNTITVFPPGPANLPEGVTVYLGSSARGFPTASYYWIKDGALINGINQRVYSFNSTLLDDGLYSVSAFNALNHFYNADLLSDTLYINITSDAPAANNQKLPEDSNFISIGAYGAGSPNLYRSINQFIKSYSGITTNTPNTYLTTRETNFMTKDTKPATGIDSPNSSYVVVMKNQQESGSTTTPYGSFKNYNTPTGTGGTYRPSRLSEFKGSYKWYSPWFNTFYNPNSNPGCRNCQTTDRTDKGTLTVQGVNNVETNIFYVNVTPAIGGIPSGWRIASPVITYNNVVNNGNTFPPFDGTQTYTIYLMDSNGFGVSQNVSALQRTFIATYP